jgi:hypothetical protein
LVSKVSFFDPNCNHVEFLAFIIFEHKTEWAMIGHAIQMRATEAGTTTVK